MRIFVPAPGGGEGQGEVEETAGHAQAAAGQRGLRRPSGGATLPAKHPEVSNVSDSTEYTPPKVWTSKPALGRFANINRPISGATHEKELPVGRHPLQLYSLGTPNGVKVTVMLEELLALGHTGAEYDAWLIRIDEGDQFGSGFVAINPNSKIPALLDRSGPKPIRVFETGAILVYLAEKFGEFLPTEPGCARRMPVLAVLADGQHALCRRRVRAFLRLCAGEDRIRDRPVRHGDEAAARRAGQAAGGQRIPGGR